MKGEQQAAWTAVKHAIQSAAPRKVTNDDVRWFAAVQMRTQTEDYTRKERNRAFFYGDWPSAATVVSTANWLLRQRSWGEEEKLLVKAAEFGRGLKPKKASS